jgi:hypothetical protein
MSIGTANFHPSVIEDEIYDILDSTSDYVVSSKEYAQAAMEAVIEFMYEKAKDNGMEYDIIDDPHPDEEGGSISICWIEDGHLHHVVLSYRYCWDCEEDEE